MAASGSSDPDANGEMAKAARMLAEATGHRWVEPCFAGVTWPAIDEVLARVAAAGARRAVLFSWSLLAGLLEQRVARAAKKVSAATGLDVRDAGRFGPDDAVAEAIAERYAEALTGDIRANCDACCYRVPLSGLEHRVAAPPPAAPGGPERSGHCRWRAEGRLALPEAQGPQRRHEVGGAHGREVDEPGVHQRGEPGRVERAARRRARSR